MQIDSWTCHVCGKRRPDAKISVHSSEKPIGDAGVIVTQNVRYCNDDPECIAKAPEVNFMKQEEAEPEEPSLLKRLLRL